MRIGAVYVKCLPARWVQRTSLLVAFRADDRRMSTSSSGNAVLILALPGNLSSLHHLPSTSSI